MKKGFLFGLALTALVSTPSFAEDQNQGQPQQQVQVGRYQIVDATFSRAPDASVKQFKQLVILDTATGALTTCDYSYIDSGKTKDKREFWWANGTCGPFSYPQPFQVPKNQKK